MSMERTESVTCPKCGNVSDFIVWGSLNADIDPEAQAQLIDGSITSHALNVDVKQMSIMACCTMTCPIVRWFIMYRKNLSIKLLR